MNHFGLRWRGIGCGCLLLLAIAGGSMFHEAARSDAKETARGLIGQAEQRGHVRVIVQLAASAEASSLAELTAQLPVATLHTLHRFTQLPLFAVDADAPTLRKLAADPLVQSISEDALLAPADASSNAVIGAPAAWAAGYDGTGWEVAVLDTGMQTNHPFLAGKVAAEACFSTTSTIATTVCPNGQSTAGGQPGQTGSGSGVNCSTTIAGCDHGTHAAGVIAGRNYNGGPGYDGVARSARLISLQVYSRISDSTICGGNPPCARAFTSDVLAALQYVQSLAATHSIAAVSLALASDTTNSGACDGNSLKPAIDQLRALGIATIVPAGNAGATSALSAPACISSAISVGATNNSDAVASSSNRSQVLRLYAPGVAIGSSVPGSTFGVKSGTSTAAAAVAGAWAVLRQRYPAASVDQLLATAQTSGVPINDSGFSVPRIKLDAAVATPPTATPTNTSVPTSTATPTMTATPVSTATPRTVYLPLTQR